MYKITKFTIENYRAFYGGPYKVELPNGENLLLYGENGSGKSSLMMAVKEWMHAGFQDWDEAASRNIWDDRRPAKVKLSVSDPNVAGREAEGEIGDTTVGQLAKSAWNGHAWLTYREMLKSYLLDPKSIFQFILLDVLGGFRPSATGSGESIKELWGHIENAQNKRGNSSAFIDAESNKFRQFNHLVESVLNRQLRAIVNALLEKFFDLGIQIAFKPIEVGYWKYGNGSYGKVRDFRKKRSARIITGDELEIFVTYHGNTLPDHMSQLNEARLNAIALCLFLAARMMNPNHRSGNFRTMLLDDIFIGLDTSNRMPLLKILVESEIEVKVEDRSNPGNWIIETYPLFRDYQILLSTYDRFWFNVARKWLVNQDPRRWLSYELYAHHYLDEATGVSFDHPVVRAYGNSLGAGIRYLHDRFNPDYQASANYFRKAAEELLSNFLPKKHVDAAKIAKKKEGDDPEPGPVMLKELIDRTSSLLFHLGEPINLLDDLKGHLRTLLNPLSHFESEHNPLFRRELEEIQELLLTKLPPFLDGIRFKIKEVLPQGNIVRIRFLFARRHYGYYDLVTDNDLFVIQDPAGGFSRFSGVTFKSSKGIEFVGNASPIEHKNKPVKQDLEKFRSIEDAYNYLCQFLLAQYPALQLSANYAVACKYLINRKNPRPLAELLES